MTKLKVGDVDFSEITGVSVGVSVGVGVLAGAGLYYYYKTKESVVDAVKGSKEILKDGIKDLECKLDFSKVLKNRESCRQRSTHQLSNTSRTLLEQKRLKRD